MRNMKLGKKLILAFGIVLLLFAVSGIYSFVQLRDGNAQVDFLVGSELEALLDDVANGKAVSDMLFATRGYRLTDSPDMLKALREKMDGMRTALVSTEKLIAEHPNLVDTKLFYPKLLEKTNTFLKTTDDAITAVEQKADFYKKMIDSRILAFNLVEGFRDKVVDDMLSAASQNDSAALDRRKIQFTIVNKLDSAMTDIRVLSGRLTENKFDISIGEEAIKAMDDMDGLFIDLQNAISRPEQKQLAKELEDAVHIWEKAARDYIAQRNLATKKMTEDVVGTQMDLMKLLDDYDGKTIIAMRHLSDVAVDKLTLTQYVLITSVIVAIVLGLLIALIITRMITKPINRIVELAKRAEDGDISFKKADFNYEGRDEIGTLVTAISSMVESQANITADIMGVAKKVTDEAQTLAATSQESNASMEEIRASVQEVNRLSEGNGAALEQSNAGIEEMAAGAATVAQSSTDGAESVAATGEVSEKAVAMVGQVISDMNTVGKKSEANEAQIRKLAESVEQISGFVSVITSIADQTNLLALNAAIEAARAGEAGRGFAVVADEVRKLAEESGNAAKNVSQLISSLQSNAKIAISSTVESAEIVQSTMKRAGEAQTALNEAIKRIKGVNDMIQNIAAVAEEQAASSKEMASAIDMVTRGMSEVGSRIQAVQSSSDGASIAAENVATAAQTLNELAEQMIKLLSHFKLDSGMKQLR